MVDTDIAACVVSVVAFLLPVCSRPGKLFPLLLVCKPRELSRFSSWGCLLLPFYTCCPPRKSDPVRTKFGLVHRAECMYH